MKKRKSYKVIITPSNNPNAPSFDELMQTEVKNWIEKILENGIKSGKVQIDLLNNNDKINKKIN